MTDYRVLGTTDAVTTCEICGRDELRGTIVLGVLDADGNVEAEIYAGSSCGAKAAGRKGRGAAAKLQSEADAATSKIKAEAADARAMLAHYQWNTVSFNRVVMAFRMAHLNARWAAGTSLETWQQMTRDMIARREAQIAAAVALGL